MNQKYYRQGAGNGNSRGLRPTKVPTPSLAPLRETITLSGVEKRIQHGHQLPLLSSLQKRPDSGLCTARPLREVQVC